VEHRPASWGPCCTVKDMRNAGAPGWSWRDLRKRDPEIQEHKDVCAFKHVMEYTPERQAAREWAEIMAKVKARSRVKAKSHEQGR